MMLLGELAIGAPDLLLARVALDAEDRVGVVAGHRAWVPSTRRGRCLVDAQLHVALGAGPLDGQRDLVVDRGEAEPVAQLARPAHRRAVERDDDVAGPQARA